MLEVTRLNSIRSERELFSNLTFSVSEGQWIWIKGANGSGKSSLLKILAGLLPTAGMLKWQARLITRFDHNFLQDMLYLGHKPALHPALTPFENLKWLSSLHAVPTDIRETIDCRIKSALKKMEVSTHQHFLCEQLSFGQRQRVALSRLWLGFSKLWILDEPCTGLDEEGQQRLEECLENHLMNGGLAVIASHTPLRTAMLPKQSIVLTSNTVNE